MGRRPPPVAPPTPPQVPADEPSVREFLALPPGDVGIHGPVPFCIDVFRDPTHVPLVDEFGPTVPEDPVAGREGIARTVHHLPLELQTKIVNAVLDSPFLANREERREPAKRGFTIRRRAGARAPPGPKRRRWSKQDEIELEKQILSDGGVNWEELPPGFIPEVVAFPRLVRYPDEPPRMVLTSMDGNSVAEEFPTVGVSLRQIFEWLGDFEFLSNYDLARAFRQILLEDPDLIYCFYFKGKYYKVLRVLMGASASMFILHKHARRWFGALLGSRVMKYADNVFGGNHSQAAAVDLSLEFFNLRVESRVVVNWKDLKIGVRRFVAFGHEIGLFDDGRRGWRKAPKTPLALVKDRPLETLQDLSYFTFASFFAGEFVPHLHRTMAPIIDLLPPLPTDAKVLVKLPIPAHWALAWLRAVCDEVLQVANCQLFLDRVRAKSSATRPPESGDVWDSKERLWTRQVGIRTVRVIPPRLMNYSRNSSS